LRALARVQNRADLRRSHTGARMARRAYAALRSRLGYRECMQNDRDERPFEELSIDEKIFHVWDLQKRIEEEIAGMTLSDEQIAEAERRYEEHLRDPQPCPTWEEVRRDLFPDLR
jgi:putative addiction module component (TIGR02574 family)